MEVPRDGAELAPLEVRQAKVRVWCFVVMAPLEVPQGQVLAVARSREELLVFWQLSSESGFWRDPDQQSRVKLWRVVVGLRVSCHLWVRVARRAMGARWRLLSCAPLRWRRRWKKNWHRNFCRKPDNRVCDAFQCGFENPTPVTRVMESGGGGGGGKVPAINGMW